MKPKLKIAAAFCASRWRSPAATWFPSSIRRATSSTSTTRCRPPARRGRGARLRTRTPPPGPVFPGPLPMTLNARLYPDNDLATRTGVVTGTVANMMNGKGRFQLQYGSEVLTGEATRVSNDERKGIASAYGSSGSFMSCEYQMNSPRQGAGTCTFSNGARYKLHVGS